MMDPQVPASKVVIGRIQSNRWHRRLHFQIPVLCGIMALMSSLCEVVTFRSCARVQVPPGISRPRLYVVVAPLATHFTTQG